MIICKIELHVVPALVESQITPTDSQVMPGNGTVQSCKLSDRSRLLLMGKTRLQLGQEDIDVFLR